MICWHEWEEPAYNEALDLREGFKKCQKCSSIKGFRRWVPLDPESVREDATRGFDIKDVIVGALMILVGSGVSFSVHPIIQEATAEAEATGNLTGPQLALFGILPMVFFVLPVLAGLGRIISGFGQTVVVPDEEEQPGAIDSEVA